MAVLFIKKKKLSTKTMIFISLLVAQGTVLGLFENMIPFPFAFAPGAKLGLANLITLIALFTLPVSQSLLLVVLRLFLTTLLSGSLSTFFYSAMGSILSYIGMILVKSLGPKRVSIIGISATGGFLHNVGQLLVASVIAQSFSVMLYLPFLSLIGLLSGSVLGIGANYLLQHVTTLQYFQKEYEQTLPFKKRFHIKKGGS